MKRTHNKMPHAEFKQLLLLGFGRLLESHNSVKFFLVAMLFIIFDVEIVFLYPWAIVFKDFLRSGAGPIAFAVAAVFLGILLLGLVYAWGRGALEWEE